MGDSKGYVLDANVFIEAKNRYYGFGLCPGFWHALAFEHEAGRLISIDRIRDELTAWDDELKTWAKQVVPGSFFGATREEVVAGHYRQFVSWVESHERFTQAAKEEFAKVADGWVVAFAKAHSLIVVTQEERAPEARKRIPIPNLCLEFGVDYVNTFEMLTDLGVEFVLNQD